MVHRQSLMDRIEAGINQGFVLISAPPGYGKTTLVADWAKNKKPVAWITLDSQDNDLLVFNRYLVSLAEDLKIADQDRPGEFALESSAEDHFYSLLISLINNCSQIESEFTLVLDDYHVIENPKIHNGFQFLLDHFPDHFRLVIITRSDPPFQLARLRARNRLLEIRAADLCFSMAETGEFFQKTVQLNLSADDIGQAHKRTEGWITGLQLEALTHTGLDSPRIPGKAFSGNPNLTMEYMIDEVFYHQSPTIQEFLLKTSILDNLYGPLCDYILDQHEPGKTSQSILHSLFHSNLFLTPLDNHELWFRFHPLFSQALRSLLNEKYPADVPDLYLKASEWCDQNGLYQEALYYVGESNDKFRFVNLLEKYSLNAFRSETILDTLGWIKKIDGDLISTSPLLSLIYSIGLMMSVELESSAIWLEKSRIALSSGKISPVLLPFENDLWGLWHAGQSMLYSLRGDIDQALAFSSKAMQLLPEESGFSHCFALLNNGFTFALNGELDKAVHFFEETIEDSQRMGNWVTLLIARSNLAELYIDRGKLSQALVLFNQSLKSLPETPGQSSGIRGYLYKEMGEVYLVRNELKEAKRYLLEGADLTRDWMPSLNDLDTHIRLARLYHCEGDFQASHHEISLARNLADTTQGQLDDLIIDITETNLGLLRGQTNQALVWAQKRGLLSDEYQDVIKKLPIAISIPTCLVLARLYLVNGRLVNDHSQIEQSIKIIINLLPSIENANLCEYQIEGLVLLALAYHELDRVPDMLKALETAFRLAEPEQIRQVFLDEGIPMSRLVTHFLAYIKLNKPVDGIPSRAFLSDLLFRFTGRENESTSTNNAFENDSSKNDTIFLADMLTSREKEVMNLVAGGKTNGQIAQQLHLSINTVKRHLNNVFLKLGVTTRTQAINVARKQGWIK